MTELSDKQKLALCAALGTGVVLGASGLFIYQRLSQNVGLRVTGQDFSQEIATLSTHIQILRKDIDILKQGTSTAALVPVVENDSNPPALKSAFKKASRHPCVRTESQSSDNLEPPAYLPSQESLELPSATRKRTLSWGSGLTRGSASSSGTDYYSAIDTDEETEIVPLTHRNVQNFGYGEGPLDELFAKLDDLMEGSHEQQQLSLELLLENLKDNDSKSSYIWRLCKSQYLCSILAGRNNDEVRKKELIMEAVSTGQTAIKLDASDSEAHKWFAIALGSRGEFSGVTEKISDGYEFKKHIDLAAQLNPTDYITQHLLGRFCYEVCQLSWVERRMASTLFAEPPSATLEEAIQHFTQAENLKPDGWKENRLYLAKCCICLGDYNRAVIWLDKADSIPLASPDVREGIQDKVSQEEIDKLLVKYESYRCKK